MSLSNPNRYGLILLVLFISMSFFVNLADSAGEKDSPDLSRGQQEENTEEILKTQESTEEEDLPDLSKSQQEENTEEVTEVQVIAEEGKTENKEVVTRMFRIRNLDIDEAKGRIKELSTKDEQIGASVEVFTVLHSGEEVNFLLVKDAPPKIQEIGQVLEELEKEFAPITVDLDFSDVPLNQILATIARTADLNIIGGEELSQRISVHLKDVPLEDAFDIILKSEGYTYIRDGKILWIIPKEEAPLATEVFELQFTSAERIKEAVSHLVTKDENVKIFSKFSKKEYSNSLIVTDTPESLEAIRELIKKLDKKLRQVMIEAKFCEVTLDKDIEFGIDWVIKASISGASGPTALPFQRRGQRLIERPIDFEKTSGSITLGTMSFADFTATLKALDTETKVDLIASPRIATRDGEEVEIAIGDRVPIPIYERMAQTGLMEVTGYQTEEVGVLLKVTPVINSDNTVTLRIHPEVSEITGWTGPNNERPILSTREMTTVFTVENGKTVVLGGLTKQTLSNTLRKVPVLGSIPVLGNLFRYRDESEDKTDLLIFITPHILEEPVPKEELTLKK